MKRIYAKYCCCIVEGKLDVVTFPNPDKDLEAFEKVKERATYLRKEYGSRCYPALITQILEP